LDLPAPGGGLRPLPHDARLYILPGIPELCRAKIEALEALPGELPDAGGWALEVLHTDRDAADIADALNGTVARSAAVEIGSYPRWTADDRGQLRCIVRLTFEAHGGARELARAARDALALALGPDGVVDDPA